MKWFGSCWAVGFALTLTIRAMLETVSKAANVKRAMGSFFILSSPSN
jgi:hypothetical protein